MASFEGFADLERSGWGDDDISAGYVALFSSASDMAVPAIVDEIAPGVRVLDLCCGQGNVSEGLIRGGCSVVGADFSAKMLEHARRRVADAEFIEADAQDLPFEDAEFDAVVCSFGMMHIPDQPRALNEVRRVLTPGGKFIMTSWYGPEVSPVFQVFYGAVREHGDPAVAMPHSPDFHQFANADTARLLLGAAGLAVETFRRIDCYWLIDSPDTVFEIFRKGAPRGGHLLRQQPDGRREAIKAAVAAAARERFADGDKWRAPIPAAMIVAYAV